MQRHGEGILNLELRVERPSGSSLVQDYVAEEPRAVIFFGRSHARIDSYLEKAVEVDTRFDGAARKRAAELVRAPTPAAAAALERWVGEGGYFVTTGQQPGLFTGPLYSVYKALSAVRLARVLTEKVKKPVLPLFWVASEDHDWAEVDHTFVVDTTNELRRVDLRLEPPPGERPIHRVPLDGAVGDCLDRFAESFPDNDFKADAMALLRAAYAPDRHLGEAYRAALEGLLGRYDVLFVDAADPGVKEHSLPLLLDELEGSRAGEDMLARRAGELEAAGYHVQVPILPEGVNLFLEGPAGRERVHRAEGGFRLRHSDLRLSGDEIRDRATTDPSILSPGVLLRPVVESTLFPVLSYVGGPGEVAYFAQLPEYFERFGIRMPVVHPRFSVTVLEGKIVKVLDKFGLEPSALAQPHHELAAAITREEIPDDVRTALGELRGGIGKGAAGLQKAAQAIDATLKGPVGHFRSVAFAALEDVEKKIVASLKRENDIALGQLEKAQLHLYPLGKPQERVLNAFYYLARYGRGFLDAVLERMRVEWAAPGGEDA